MLAMNTQRQKLTLKKTMPATVPLKAPVTILQPKLVAKVKVTKPNPDKEYQKKENIKFSAELSARKRESIVKIQPIIDAYFSSKTIMSEIIQINSVACLKPLAIGVRKIIFANLKAQPEFQDCSSTTLNQLISKVLQPHTKQPEYIAGLVHCSERFSIDGVSDGEVTANHRAKAAKRSAGKTVSS